MTDSIQALREKKNQLSQEANKILDQHKERMPAEAAEKFDQLMDEAEDIGRSIARQQRTLNEKAEIVLKKDADPDKVRQRQGVEVFLRTKAVDRTPEQRDLVLNTMSTTTGNQGGYTTPALISADFIDTLKNFNGMRRVASQMTTAGGNDMSVPTTDGTAEVGEIVAQNATASNADPSFGTVPLNVVKFGSKIITVPIELIQDSAIDVVALVMKRLRQRIGRIQNQKYTNGSGTAEPWGLTAAASVGKTGTTGQTTTIIYDDLVDLVDSIDEAYLDEGDLTWQFSQTMRRAIRKLKDSQNRPIWTPGYEGGITQGTPDLLLGYPVNINNDMPTPAANAKSVSFGQHKRYEIRDAMDVTLFRFDDSPYVSKGCYGFLAWARSGGNLVDTSAVKLYQHSAT